METSKSEQTNTIADEMLRALFGLIVMIVIFLCKVGEFLLNRTAWLLEKLIDNGKSK